jgi:hypothetical protein
LSDSGHLGLLIVARFVLGRREVHERFEQAPGIGPGHPDQRREFRRLQG